MQPLPLTTTMLSAPRSHSNWASLSSVLGDSPGLAANLQYSPLIGPLPQPATWLVLPAASASAKPRWWRSLKVTRLYAWLIIIQLIKIFWFWIRNNTSTATVVMRVLLAHGWTPPAHNTEANNNSWLPWAGSQHWPIRAENSVRLEIKPNIWEAILSLKTKLDTCYLMMIKCKS